MKRIFPALAASLALFPAAHRPQERILTRREQAALQQSWILKRFDYGGFFIVVQTQNHKQWEGPREVVEQRDLEAIGNDTWELFAHADALSAAEPEGVPGRGDYVLRADTRHAIEHNVPHAVREWFGPNVRFPLEEDAILTERGWEWVAGRQTAYDPIR